MERLIIVTGATGHLGLNLVRLLISNGEKVRALVLPGDPLAIYLPKEVEVVMGSVIHPKDIERLFIGITTPVVVIHCAAIVSITWKYQANVHQVNVEGTRHLLEASKSHHVDRFIYISSVHALPEKIDQVVTEEDAYFNPNEVKGDYAKTKAEAAELVRQAITNGLPGTMVFPSGMIGPWDFARGNTTQTLLDAARRKLPIAIKGGYDFVDVRDVCLAIRAIIHHPNPSSMYILTNQYSSITEILAMVDQIRSAQSPHLIVPFWIATLLLPAFTLYYRIAHQKPTFTRYSLYTLRTHQLYSHDRATRELGFNPRTLERSIKDTVDWFGSLNWIGEKRLRKKAPLHR